MPSRLKIARWLKKPVRFEIMGRYLTPGSRLLDVGCGDFAPYSTFDYYPGILFSGIDWHDIPGKKDMEYFFQEDLEANDLAKVPGAYYDVVNLSHIIEHVSDGARLISALAAKVRPGGVFYIETPSERSLKLPSMYGTLNFWDDPTHKKVYSLKEMEETLLRNGYTILRSGIRRSAKRILLMPFYVILTLVRDRKVNATALWDVTGFAHYVLAKKA